MPPSTAKRKTDRADEKCVAASERTRKTWAGWGEAAANIYATLLFLVTKETQPFTIGNVHFFSSLQQKREWQCYYCQYSLDFHWSRFFSSRGRRLGRPLSDASCITQAILVLYVVLEGSPGGGFLLGGRLDITSFFFLPLCGSSLEHFAAGEDGFFPLIFLVVLSGPFISPRFVPLLSIMMEGGAFIERAANDSISKAKQGPL